MQFPYALVPLILAASLLQEAPSDTPMAALEAAVRKFDEGITSGDKERQVQAMRAILPTKADIAKLFPRHADKLWELYDKLNNKHLEHVEAGAKRMMRSGKLLAVKASDARTDKVFAEGSYRRVLELLPKEISIAVVSLQRENVTQGGIPFVQLDGRWVLVPELNGVPDYLETK